MKKALIVSGMLLSIVSGSLALTAYASSPDDVNQAALAKSAKLTPVEAQKIALKKVPGKVLETDLDKDFGTVVYDVVIYDGTTVKEINLDANTGKILNVALDDDVKEKLELVKKLK
jgi:uncharacterized membrane protein YkoI